MKFKDVNIVRLLAYHDRRILHINGIQIAKDVLMFYLMICYNGRFGLILMSNNLRRTNQDLKRSEYLNFDKIDSLVNFLKFRLDYKFTDYSLENLCRKLTQVVKEIKLGTNMIIKTHNQSHLSDILKNLPSSSGRTKKSSGSSSSSI